MIKNKKVFNSFFLLLFLLITLSVNFTHTEKHVVDNDNCPACHFQSSTLTTNHINFFHIPQLFILERLQIQLFVSSDQIIYIHPSSRSPPQI